MPSFKSDVPSVMPAQAGIQTRVVLLESKYPGFPPRLMICRGDVRIHEAVVMKYLTVIENGSAKTPYSRL